MVGFIFTEDWEGMGWGEGEGRWGGECVHVRREREGGRKSCREGKGREAGEG